MDGWPPPWKRVMRFLQSFLGVELVNSPAKWCKGWGTWDTLTAGIIRKWSALIIQWPLIKIESNANVGIIYVVNLSCLTCVGHAYLFLKKRKKNIKNFCHQVNDGRIWHWSIVRCLVICKFYLRLITSKINSPPVSLSELSLCVGIATLKKKKSCLSSVTNHSLTLGLLFHEFKPPFELEIFKFEQQDIPLSIIVWVIML